LETGATKRLAAALGLCLAGAAVSIVLLLEHHGEGLALVSQVCGEGAASGCATVARSPYSALFGVPWAALGLFCYLSTAVLLALALAAPDPAREAAGAVALLVAAVSLVVDLALLGVQAFAVGAFCSLCILTYVVNAAILFALLPARRSLATARGALGDEVGRMTAAGWVAGSVTLALAVFAAEVALAERAAARASTLLGVAAPVATPAAPPPAGTPGLPAADSEAERWRAEARRLQETLDDPQKLDQYFAEKAAREFEGAAVQRFDLEDVPYKGPSGAPVQVVEFSDFLCPFCRNIAAGFNGFVPQAGGRVQLYFKNYPLDRECSPKLKASTHPGACWLALGGICAQYQGRFWPYHDRVFQADLKKPQPADVVRLAAGSGLNAAAFESCLLDPRTKQRLAAEIAEAQRAGVEATPTLFVNGKKLPRVNEFVPVVDKEAQAKGFPPLAGASGR
jgi:protein-disulfide isomerase/uncharacterized membrane protein